MNRCKAGICAFGVVVVFASGSAIAVTREIAELRQRVPLTLRQSVISQLTSGVLKDPYDEFLTRPYNLGYVNLERRPNLSPWPGQQGEQTRYVDFLIGNNGNTDVVAGGADTLQGTFIGQPAGRFSWGLSAALLADEFDNTNESLTSITEEGGSLLGGDLRFGMGYRLSDRIVLGGGIGAANSRDEMNDDTSTPGVGGSRDRQEIVQSGFELDFGLRHFTGEDRSWELRLLAGVGETTVDDFAETLDGSGQVTGRRVTTDYDVDDSLLQLSGGYNHRFVDDSGEMQVQLGVRRTTQELANSVLRSLDSGSGPVPEITLLGHDPVTTESVFVSGETLFIRGWTQIFGSASLTFSRTAGSTRIDALGNIVNESIDDSQANLGLVMGLRQPLWNEKFRLIARARGDWFTESEKTGFEVSSIRTDSTRTRSRFAIGIETVLNNMVFDLAWLFGGDPPPGAATEASRQTIDLDRLVISASFGW